jgi:hypothetical protein
MLTKASGSRVFESITMPETPYSWACEATGKRKAAAKMHSRYKVSLVIVI